jgi:hypothetical protein
MELILAVPGADPLGPLFKIIRSLLHRRRHPVTSAEAS